MISVFGRAAASKITMPIARVLLKAGITPDAVTLIGTVGTIAGALWLFPTGHLFWGAFCVWMFVMFDMLDGAVARARGGGTPFGAVLDATCDRVADGAIFAALAWWAVYTEGSKPLLIATLICLVCSQVISYAKARAEASGLSANGGLIERPERLIIVLVGAGLTGLLGVWWIVHAAMWLLAAGSVVTVAQRVLEARRSPGARTLTPIAAAPVQGESDSDAAGTGR